MEKNIFKNYDFFFIPGIIKSAIFAYYINWCLKRHPVYEFQLNLVTFAD